MGSPLDLTPVGMGIGAATDVFKIFEGFHQNHLANQIHPEYHAYESSPYAKDQLGVAQQLFNGRMAGAGSEERNIANSQANYQSAVSNNATDSGQALSLGGLSQGITNNSYNDLQTKEAQNKYSLLNNLNTAYGTMINEGDKVYQDQLQKYQIDLQQKAQLKNAGFQNIFSGAGDIAGGLIQYSNSTGVFGNDKTTTQ